MKNNKKVFIGIITLLMLIITIYSASSTEWTQYTPSPTTNSIIKVVATNGKAFGITTDGTNFIMYNGTDWKEIAKPNSSTTGGNTFIAETSGDDYMSFDKTADGNVLLLYYKVIAANIYNVTIMKYNLNTETYSVYATRPNSYHYSNNYNYFGIDCQPDNNKCYLEIFGSSQIHEEIYEITSGSITWISNITLAINCIEDSDNKLLMTAPSAEAIQEWNGISWVDRSPTYTGDTDCLSTRRSEYLSASQRVYGMTGSYPACSKIGLIFYNYTAGKYGLLLNTYITSSTKNLSGPVDFVDIGGSIYFISYRTSPTLNYVCRTTWNTNNSDQITCESLLAQGLSIDYDNNNNKGWLVGYGGMIYEYQGIIGDIYSLNSRLSNNPSIYGTNVTFYATPSSPDGYTSTISVNILNGSTTIYTWSWLNVPSGYEASNKISGIAWTNFDIGTYTVRITSNDSVGHTATATDITWNVTGSGGNITEKVYSINESSINMTGFSMINSIDNYGTDIIYSIAKNESNSDLMILSVDTTNMNNIFFTNFSINSSIKTSGLSTLNALNVYLERLYLGTNNELFIFNTTQSGNAQDLAFQDSIAVSGIFNDNILDVAKVDDELVWVCNQGLLSSAQQRFNYSTMSFQNSTSTSPCKSIYYYSNKDLMLVHTGSSVVIYNSSSMAILSTISINSIQGNSKDLISISGNNLYFVDGSNGIKKYDITVASSPVYRKTCRTGEAVYTLEYVANDEVIIGSFDKLKVCDFDNNNTYDSLNNYYIATPVYSFLGVDSVKGGIFEILKISSDKLAIAGGTTIYVITYSTSNKTSYANEPPIISSISVSDSSPCLNQPITIDVIANDTEGNDLTYDWDCSGARAEMINNYRFHDFTCIYNQEMGRDIPVWVTDGYNIPVKATTHIDVTNCTANYTLLFKVEDCSNFENHNGLSGVTITLSNGDTSTTDSTGRATFELTGSNAVNVSFTKDNYWEKTVELTPSGYTYTICLQPLTDASGEFLTTLIVLTKDSSGNGISGSLVGATDVLTGMSVNGITNVNGSVTFTDMFTSDRIIVGARNEESGYEYTSTYTSISEHQVKTITLTMTKRASESDILTPTGRNCADTIKGVWLCGFLNTSGTGNSCHNNSQCISGRCGYSPSSLNGRECSRFNYTICVDKGLSFTQSCVVSETIVGFFKGTTANIIKYFLYVIVLIGIIYVIVLLRRERK